MLRSLPLTVIPFQNNLNIGYVGICILPFFFVSQFLAYAVYENSKTMQGISQCLITARLSLVGSTGTESAELTNVQFASNFAATVVSCSPRDAVFASRTESTRSEDIDSEKNIKVSMSMTRDRSM